MPRYEETISRENQRNVCGWQTHGEDAWIRWTAENAVRVVFWFQRILYSRQVQLSQCLWQWRKPSYSYCSIVLLLSHLRLRKVQDFPTSPIPWTDPALSSIDEALPVHQTRRVLPHCKVQACTASVPSTKQAPFLCVFTSTPKGASQTYLWGGFAAPLRPWAVRCERGTSPSPGHPSFLHTCSCFVAWVNRPAPRRCWSPTRLRPIPLLSCLCHQCQLLR